MQTLADFQNKTAVLKQLLRTLYDKIKLKKQHDAVYRSAHQLEAQMALRGEWLNVSFAQDKSS